MGFFLNDYFVANGISLRKRVSDLFDELEKNPELAQVFIRNPSLVLQSRVLPEFAVINEDSINAANQFLYSVLSNDKFMKWLESYQTKLMDQHDKTEKLPSKKKILQQFAKGLIENGDPKILSDLLEISSKTKASTMPLPKIPSESLWEITFFKVFVYLNEVVAEHEIVAFMWQIVIVDYLFHPREISLLDENQKIATISPKELKSLSEQIVKYARKMREQTEESTLEE